MAYSQFKTLKSIRENLGVKVHYRKLFESPQPVAPTALLRETLNLATEHRTAFFSEKSRSEALVFPVLFEIQRRHNFQFSLYSGALLEADPQKGLNGECDFVLSLGEQSIELEKPLICVVEAKDNDIELGIPQCIAQMVGAKIFNEAENNDFKNIFGAVTIGDTWLFLKLEDNTVFIDNQHYYLNQLEILLGILDSIVVGFLEK